MSVDSEYSEYMERRCRILAVGVGGQGVLSAALVLGEAARLEGLLVRVGQIHGLSQRGGSVESTIVIGPGQTSFIGAGQADIVLGLEPVETLRAIGSMSASTQVLMSRTPVPLTLATHKGQVYPELESILASIDSVTTQVVSLDCQEMVAATGEPKSHNILMLGALVGLRILPFGAEAMARAVESRSPPRYLEANRQALKLGIELMESMAE